MGFAPVAAVLIMFLSGMIAYGNYVAQADASQDALREAQRANDIRVYERAETALHIETAVYVPGLQQLTITATNDGTTVIDTEALDILLDGEHHTDDIVTILVEGSAQRYWSPAQDISIVMLGVGGEPNRIAINTPQGVSAYYEV